jgi:hypothetical protein
MTAKTATQQKPAPKPEPRPQPPLPASLRPITGKTGPKHTY